MKYCPRRRYQLLKPKEKTNYNPEEVMWNFMDIVTDVFDSYDDKTDDVVPEPERRGQ